MLTTTLDPTKSQGESKKHITVETQNLNESRGVVFCSPRMVSILHFLVFRVFSNFVTSIAIYIIFVEF